MNKSSLRCRASGSEILKLLNYLAAISEPLRTYLKVMMKQIKNMNPYKTRLKNLTETAVNTDENTQAEALGKRLVIEISHYAIATI